jgi:aryl-alcohol dehydrogenase-like predicted oxidoreductase
VLRELGAPALVGTKVYLEPGDFERLEASVVAHAEASLRRLGRDRVEVLYFHHFLGAQRQKAQAGVADLEPVLRALQRLQQQGKAQVVGFNGLGETGVVHQALGLEGFQALQTCYNLLNPTGGRPAPAGFPFQDYGQLIDKAASQGKGVVAIRVLAGGALSGSPQRHPVGTAAVGPISTSADYDGDVERARRFSFLVEEGHASSLAEAAVRFALGKEGISSALVGISSLEQLEAAAQAQAKGPLPPKVLGRLEEVWKKP